MESSQDLTSQIRKQISDASIMVYSKTYCPYCVEAKSQLNKLGARFELVELDNVPNGDQIQNTLRQITGQRTVPNIFIGGEHVGGCDDLKAKIRNGKVQELFTKHNIRL